LDTRSKNTLNELCSFDEPMDALLDRVFDEYGLVVCGWSAEWDIALRRAIDRCPSRRFGAFWAAYNGLTTAEAEQLITNRRAQKISIHGADSFFGELVEKVLALESFSGRDPIPAKVAVARMKKYMQEPLRPIDFSDLVRGEVERVYAVIHSEIFQVGSGAITPESIIDRLNRYEAALQVLTAMLACGGRWASADAHVDCLCSAVKRIADDSRAYGGITVWLDLRRYPALLAFYALGLGAIAGNKFSILRYIFETMVRNGGGRGEISIVEALNPYKVLDHRTQRLLPGRDRQHTPLNDHVFEFLQDAMQDSLPDLTTYEEAFDTFEYLAGMVSYKNSKRGSCGRFLWRRFDGSVQARMAPLEDGSDPPIVRRILASGLFGPPDVAETAERFRTNKRGFDEFIGLVRRERLIFSS
jgi:hypothetical protein